ncbi:hypothetical protein ACFV9C_42435 [Kribbella sp. NPDC059898]|uniref:hypothetical protein n=1 Tax=Kribbella sp. NPDC059898 TaxID=3346995 RepID=UPI00364B57CE
MTTTASYMEHLEQVHEWLAQSSPGDQLDWRSFVHAGPDGTPVQPVLVVIWDAGETPCLSCRRNERRGCPVALDAETGEVRTVFARHDCGAESAPARHITRWLSEITTDAEARRLLHSLDQYRPISPTPLLPVRPLAVDQGNGARS